MLSSFEIRPLNYLFRIIQKYINIRKGMDKQVMTNVITILTKVAFLKYSTMQVLCQFPNVKLL